MAAAISAELVRRGCRPIGRSHYSQIEVGSKRPSLEVALAIASVLGQPVEVLFAGLVPDGQPAASGE